MGFLLFRDTYMKISKHKHRRCFQQHIIKRNNKTSSINYKRTWNA